MPRQTIGDRYELEQPLGGGAMSAVWLAHDTDLERRVAVKVLARDADRRRFEREARAVALLSHPNICQLYDYGEAEQGPYMVLEYLPGGTLEDRLAGEKPLPDRETSRIAREVSAGLAHAHEHGLVHRDLKPANILFDSEGRAKIADFGIARIGGAGVLTEAGTVLGTAAYISPEQAAGLPATPASDVYSFGAILFRMLTGRAPFTSDSAMELVRMHRDEEPPPVERFRDDAPPALAGLAFAALAKDPAQRPRDGDALLAELAGAADATALTAATAATALLGTAARDTPPTQVLARSRRPRPRAAVLPLVLAGTALLALAGIATAFVLTRGDDAGGPTPTPSLELPTAGTEKTSTGIHSTTAPATTTAETSTLQTTAQQTTAQQTTTQRTGTEQTTTSRPTTQSTTSTPPTTTTLPTTSTAPPTTTAITTTTPPPSTTAPATTATAPATTTAATTTTATAVPTTTTVVTS
jgi:serine/threonine-protein kinase